MTSHQMSPSDEGRALRKIAIACQLDLDQRNFSPDFSYAIGLVMEVCRLTVRTNSAQTLIDHVLLRLSEYSFQPPDGRTRTGNYVDALNQAIEGISNLERGFFLYERERDKRGS